LELNTRGRTPAYLLNILEDRFEVAVFAIQNRLNQ